MSTAVPPTVIPEIPVEEPVACPNDDPVVDCISETEFSPGQTATAEILAPTPDVSPEPVVSIDLGRTEEPNVLETAIMVDLRRVEPLARIPMNPDILAAFDFTGAVNQKVEANLESMGTYPFIKLAVESDRRSDTINNIAHKIGMCIPQAMQTGHLAYTYFIDNASKYERVLAGIPRDFPSLEVIFMKTNTFIYLSQFQDDYLVSRCPDSYVSREDLINRFITANITSQGRFYMPIDVMTVYKNMKTECFVYKVNSIETFMSMETIKTGISQKKFTNLTLMHLRQSLLEKVHFWTQTTNKKVKVTAVDAFLKSLEHALESKKDVVLANFYTKTTLQL